MTLQSLARCGFAVLVLAGSSVVADAAPILDQSFTLNPVSFGAAVYASNARAQTFTVGVSGLLTQVDLQVWRQSTANANLTVDVRRASAGFPLFGAGDLLGTATVAPAQVTTTLFSTALVSVDFSAAPIAVSAGDVLALVLTTPGTGIADWYLWATSTVDAYAGGVGSVGPAGGPFSVNGDSAFQTWVAPPVPEPASLILLGAAVTGLVARRRRMS